MKKEFNLEFLNMIESIMTTIDRTEKLKAVDYAAHVSKILQDHSASILNYARANEDVRQIVRTALQSQKNIIKEMK